MKWIVRIAGSLMAVALLTLLAGAAYEHRARLRVAAQYPPAGKRVDIGGRRMQLDCRGRGTPAVVFEAGRDLRGSLSWYLVHDRVAAIYARLRLQPCRHSLERFEGSAQHGQRCRARPA